MTTTKVHQNTTILPKLDGISSKDNHATVIHQLRNHHSTRLTRQKEKCQIRNLSPSKAESASEEVYTTPSNNDDIRISSSIHRKHQTKQDIRVNSHRDVDEESTAIATQMPIERIQHLSTPTNNSATQQQAMGDHIHSNMKQHKIRNKTTNNSKKYHRLIEQQDFDLQLNEKTVEYWRLFIYLLTITVFIYVIYRFILIIWPKPKKTFIEQMIDDISHFFTL